MAGRVRAAAWVLLAATAAALAGCDSRGEPAADATALDDDAVTIASFDFAESEVLGALYGEALERAGIEVEHAARVGPRELVQPALSAGLVEFVPEYAGTALEFLSLGTRRPSADIGATHAGLSEATADRDVLALTPAPAQDTNAIAVTGLTAQRHGLQTVSDLAPLAGELVFGGPPECPVRPFCLDGLRRVYGLSFESFIPLDSGGLLTRQALGRGDIDVALLFSTDPNVDLEGFMLLTDDRALQPAENVTPLVRAEVVDRWGDALVERVDQVSALLTTAELTRLNAEVQGGDEVSDVAAQWLDRMGIR